MSRAKDATAATVLGGEMVELCPRRATLCCCRKATPLSAKAGPGIMLRSGHAAEPGATPCPPVVDVASASNFSSFRLRHFHLDLRVNFAQRELSGWQVLDLELARPGVETLVLDSHPSQLIHSVDYQVRGSGQQGAVSLTYRLEPFAEYGSALSIALPASVSRGRCFQVTIRYSTTDGPALWWLEPVLTCGQSGPMLFTQGHSVQSRSFFPGFDTPAVKSTYSATVRVPEGVTVLMSASRSAFSKHDRVFQFHMDHPVPAYLVAMVAGHLQHAEIGPRSRVWAEPCLLPCAVETLGGNVEQWLAAAEDLFGAYLWGRCDLVFLPPSFPIVAMENPCLTFIISSILESQDFLFVDVVHEIAHAWFGNAVTNACWSDMWLSEGLATYAQRRITTQAHGEAFTCLETELRLDALHRQLRLLGDQTPVSKLQVNLDPGVNPSSVMNLFTYEKGFCFVSYLSQLCGDISKFDSFLRAYVAHFKFSSVLAEDLIEAYLDFFPALKEQRTGLHLDQWLSGAGPPPVLPDVGAGRALTGPVRSLLGLWAGQHPPSPKALEPFDLRSWGSLQVALFLDHMIERCPLEDEVMNSLSGCYSGVVDGLNAEVQVRWLQIVVRNNFYPDLHRLYAFLNKHTSRMYTLPLYEDLVAGEMRAVAAEIFHQSETRLHPNLRRIIRHLLPAVDGNALSPLCPSPLQTINVSA